MEEDFYPHGFTYEKESTKAEEEDLIGAQSKSKNSLFPK